MRINIFAVINQISKHKVKIYNHCAYTIIIIKKRTSQYIIFFVFVKYKNDKSIIRRAKTNSTK